MVILDTSIIIDHLRQKGPKDSILSKLVKKSKPDVLAISMITIQELFAGQSTKESEIEKWILAVLSPYRILPYTYEVSKLAGEIERDLDIEIEFPDSAIAATAILNDCSLSTINKKDFVNIKNLQLAD